MLQAWSPSFWRFVSVAIVAVVLTELVRVVWKAVSVYTVRTSAGVTGGLACLACWFVSQSSFGAAVVVLGRHHRGVVVVGGGASSGAGANEENVWHQDRVGAATATGVAESSSSFPHVAAVFGMLGSSFLLGGIVVISLIAFQVRARGLARCVWRDRCGATDCTWHATHPPHCSLSNSRRRVYRLQLSGPANVFVCI